jgi:hypothetical protein
MSQLLASTIRGQKLGALSYVDGTSAPTYFSNGLPYENDGSVAVAVDGVIDHYHQGLPFTAYGRLVVTLSGPPTRFGGGAAPFSASGQLVLGSDVTHYSGGIPFTATSAINSITGAPPLNQRYFTQLDGQSKYWRRIEPDYGQTTNATIECLFFGADNSVTEVLVGRISNSKFYLAVSGGQVGYGDGSAFTSGLTTIDPTKINHAKLVADGINVTFFVNGVQITQIAQTWTGALDSVAFGSNNGTANLYNGILVSARVTTDTVDNVYGLDTNLPYDLADGTTDPLADSTLIFENGSIDGSDRLLVTERQDNSGFLGEDLWPDGVKAIAGNATTTGINSISINETGTALAAVGIAAPAVPVTLSGFANLATGQVDISVIPAFAGVVVSITQSGAFSFDLESQGAINFKRSFANGAQATITNIKVEPTYDYAAGAAPPVDSYSDSYTDSYE